MQEVKKCKPTSWYRELAFQHHIRTMYNLDGPCNAVTATQNLSQIMTMTTINCTVLGSNTPLLTDTNSIFGNRVECRNDYINIKSMFCLFTEMLS